MDEWVEARDDPPEVFGQIANPGPRGYQPRHFAWEPFVSPQEFSRRVETCDFLIAHAGMGSIINAQSVGKRIVILPRRAELREHRNDHQVATAEQFADRDGVWVARDEGALPALLDRLVAEGNAREIASVTPFAEPRLLAVLRHFIRGDSSRS